MNIKSDVTRKQFLVRNREKPTGNQRNRDSHVPEHHKLQVNRTKTYKTSN